MPTTRINGQNILFIHIPKTGGTSVEHYLSRHGPINLKGGGYTQGMRCSPQHLHLADLASLGALHDQDWTFTLVRHPVARIISEYRYQMRKPKLLRSRMTFSIWLTYALSRRRLNPYYRDNHFRPQHEFVGPGVEVMRFEDGVGGCLRRITDQLGTPVPSSTIWQKNSQETSLLLSAGAIRAIEKVYARDFAEFKYKTDRSSLLAAGISLGMLSDSSGS